MGRKPTVRPVKQLNVSFGKELWTAIREFQHVSRVTSITEAVRLLIWAGLEARGIVTPRGEPEN